MTETIRPLRNFASTALAAAFACGSVPASAQSEPELAVDVSVGGGVATNPFLAADSKTSGFATVGIAPSIVIEDELGETRIGGNLLLTQYLQRYGSDISGSIDGSTTRRLDEQTSVRISASASTARSATRDSLSFGSAPMEVQGPLAPPTLPVIDTTIVGTNARTTRIGANLGISHLLDELSSVSADIALNGTYIGDDVGFDYRNAITTLVYQRKVGPRTTLTLSTEVGAVDYLGQRIGDSVIVSPRVGIQQQLNNRLSLVANAGISYVRTVIGGGRSEQISFAGDVGVCDRGASGNLCLSAGRSAQPTALGGVSTVTTASLNYDARLSRVDGISLGARYGRTNQDGAGLPFVRTTDFIGASATYSRDLNERLALTVTPGYTKLYDDMQPSSANYSLMFGLTIKLGKRRSGR